MSLINCEINLIPAWSANCIILSTNTTNQGTLFSITDTKLNVSAVNLSNQENTKLLQ